MRIFFSLFLNVALCSAIYVAMILHGVNWFLALAVYALVTAPAVNWLAGRLTGVRAIEGLFPTSAAAEHHSR